MEEKYKISTTPAKSVWKSQDYAPVKTFQDQKFENATLTHC